MAAVEPRRATIFVRSLDELGASRGVEAGTKASTLARLRQAGFPVPDGFVVGGVSAADLDAPDVRQRVSDALDGLGGGPVAVRSSAASEDLVGASFAGQ